MLIETSRKKRFVPPPTLSSFWQFSPHLLHSLQHHVAVTVESLHPAQQLLVVPEIFHTKISKTAHCVYLQLIKTWVLFLTESVRTLRGPVENSSCCNIVINCDHCCGIWIIIIMLSSSSFITLSCITTLLLHLLLRLTLFGCHVCLTGHPDHQFYISETKFNGKLLRPLKHDSSGIFSRPNLCCVYVRSALFSFSPDVVSHHYLTNGLPGECILRDDFWF